MPTTEEKLDILYVEYDLLVAKINAIDKEREIIRTQIHKTVIKINNEENIYRQQQKNIREKKRQEGKKEL